MSTSRIDRVLAWGAARLHTRSGYALVFALLCAAVLVPVLGTCLISGKSLLWAIDGLWQQYVWFVYTGQWLRDFVANGFDPLMWEMSSGYGVDVLQSLAGTFVNPMFAISVLVPERWAEFAFEAVIVVTLYAAGLAFSLWCIQRGEDRRFVLFGALTYTFAGNALLMVSQPSFLIMLVAFPLVLWSADRVFARRGPLPYVLVMAWCFACSFYDAYMVAILLVLYCIVVFFGRVERGRDRTGRAKRLLGWVGVFAGLTAVAFLLSCVMLLPQVMALMGMERLEVERAHTLLYSLGWYASFCTAPLMPVSLGSDAYTGFNALVPVVLVALVLRRREHPVLLGVFAGLTVMMAVPFFGSLMNGFQYPADRWSYAYDACVALAVVRLLPAALALSAREKRVTVGVLAIYGALYLLLPIPIATATFAVELTLCIASLGLLFGSRAMERRRVLGGLCALVVVSVAVGLSWYISPWHGNAASGLTGFGKAQAFHTSLSPAALAEQAQEQGLYDVRYRYDRPGLDGAFVYNSNLITGWMAPNFYNSMYSDAVDAFHAGLGLTTTEGINFRYGSLGSRALLDAVLGVRYYAAWDGEYALVPYQFRSATVIANGTLNQGKHYALYEADRFVPLAFGYTQCLPRSAYNELGLLDRQEALLQAVVVSDADAAAGELPVATNALDLTAVEVPFELGEQAGCAVLPDGSIWVGAAGATLALSFQAPADAEAYLCLDDLTYEDIPLCERYSAEAWEQLGFIGRLKKQVEGLFYTRDTSASLEVTSQGASSLVYVVNAANPLYGAKHDWALCLGYSETGVHDALITFNAPGIYRFDAMTVEAQPMASFNRQVDELAFRAAEVHLQRNALVCFADVTEPELLFFSVAYGEGWSALVDGVPTEIVRANVGFMGVPLGEGSHEVVLIYRTPGLAVGGVLTMVGLIVTVALGVWWHRAVARAARR